MRQAEKSRKKFYSRIPFLLEAGKKIPKKNSKEIQKIKQVNSGIISIQKGLREAEKEKKIYQSRIPFVSDPGKKIPKKIAKKYKKSKKLFRVYFLAETV